MRSIDEIEAFLEAALANDARGRLVDRGEARAMVRRQGVLPDDAPALGITLDADLADYGFSILDGALELRNLNRSHHLLRNAFEISGRVFESLVKHGDPETPERGFHRIIAAASFHLAGYSAMAYALFAEIAREDLNLNPGEAALYLLIVRDLEGLRTMCKDWLNNSAYGDSVVSDHLDHDDFNRDVALATAVLTGMFRSLAHFEFALQTGDPDIVGEALSLLEKALGLAEWSGLVALWWVIRVTKDLIEDLWSQSMHQVIPLTLQNGVNGVYSSFREIFIARLFDRSTSQIELWPSQIDAARRAADPSDDLVVALPTSAGKTRIAELAALACLAEDKRVLIMTPLRALSAQTERSFRETFTAMGVSVSSLYGKSGVSAGDSHALANDKIVVATPEKLDFALRSDPDVINDIGLIIIDEGHMIGAEEREIRFEILVQRILRREDSGSRRIVCLSAILPEGQELLDMTAWIRLDEEGAPVRSEWRPTRQRYGTLEWRNRRGALRYNLERNGPYVSRFLTPLSAIKPDQVDKPRDKKDISLMAAWRFAKEGKKTLIFVTQANWVEGFAKRAIELTDRGYLPSLLDDVNAIKEAQTIGREWLGPAHPAVACLGIGIAVHHGKLPSPFLREIERLLASGAIKVTAASPTLAQGLNLNAAVLLAPYLVRKGQAISGEEFANVAGRAGRAFVDTEGLIVHVMDDHFEKRKRDWQSLIEQVHARSLRSGLAILIKQVIQRMNKREIPCSVDGYEFLANSREDWLIEPDGEVEDPSLVDLIARLDSIIFGLIEALDSNSDQLPGLLDEALAGSLWARQLDREDPGKKMMHKIVLDTRARLIWNETTPVQRKGHFAMGVGLDTGFTIDEMSEDLETELDRADIAAFQGDLTTLYNSLSILAEALLTIKPFAPVNGLPETWKDVLKDWLSGVPIASIAEDSVPIIEDIFVYRLVWAIEIVRTRRIAHGWTDGDPATEGMAAACLDTGLPNFQMSLLVRAGLPSREAAKSVIETFNPDILDSNDLKRWLRSDEIDTASNDLAWPSPETASLWGRFRTDFLSGQGAGWTSEDQRLEGIPKPENSGRLVRIERSEFDTMQFVTPDFRPIYLDPSNIPFPEAGLTFGTWESENILKITRIGPI